jgi:hypothetical protein
VHLVQAPDSIRADIALSLPLYHYQVVFRTIRYRVGAAVGSHFGELSLELDAAVVAYQPSPPFHFFGATVTKAVKTSGGFLYAVARTVIAIFSPPLYYEAWVVVYFPLSPSGRVVSSSYISITNVSFATRVREFIVLRPISRWL